MAPQVHRRVASELEGLDLEVLLEAKLAEFAAMSRLLEPAEGGRHVERAAVDVDLPGAEPAGDGLCMVGVGCPDGACEPVDRIVGDLDRLFLAVVRNDR